MTRRIVLSLTALAVIGVGVGTASAATTHSSSAPSVGTSTPPNQFCLLLYRGSNPNPQHICVNW